MNDLNISIFGNKIFLEIIKELKLFSKIKYYEDLDLCVKDAASLNLPVIFFINENDKQLFDRKKLNSNDLINKVRKRVFEKTGIKLELELSVIGKDK